jgi:hypothetical protein
MLGVTKSVSFGIPLLLQNFFADGQAKVSPLAQLGNQLYSHSLPPLY